MTKRTKAILNIVVVLFFTAIAWKTSSGWAEIIGGLTGLWCVWLTAQESIWNYPVGFVNVGAWYYMFNQAHLYADADLQLFFGILMIYGLFVWLTKRGNRSVRPTTRIQVWEVVAGLVIVVGGTYFWGKHLIQIQDIAPYVDAFTAMLSVVAQYLLSRKVLENWWCWITVDVVSIILYFTKGLPATGFVYCVFLLIAIGGLIGWQKNWKSDTSRGQGVGM